MSAKLKKLQKLKNNFFCDEKNILCRAVLIARHFFLRFVDGVTAAGGVAAVIKIWGVIWIYKRRIMYIMYSLV